MAYTSTTSISDSTKTKQAGVSLQGDLSVSDKEIITLLRELLYVNKVVANQLMQITGQGQCYFDTSSGGLT